MSRNKLPYDDVDKFFDDLVNHLRYLLQQRDEYKKKYENLADCVYGEINVRNGQVCGNCGHCIMGQWGRGQEDYGYYCELTDVPFCYGGPDKNNKSCRNWTEEKHE